MRTYISRHPIILTLLLVGIGQVHAAQFDATLQWAKRVELGVPISGVIQSVFADVGQRVAKDDKLLQLDDTVFKAQVKEATAAVKNQEAQNKEAGREMDRAQNLYDRTVLSDHDLQVAKDNKIQAAARLEAAKARLVKAQQKLKYSTLRAPFNALVLERDAQVGKVIAAKLKPETLFIVADADQMLARLLVSETQLAQLKLKQAAKVLIGDKQFDGVIISIGFEPVKGNGNDTSYPVDVEFAMGQDVLRAGQHVKVELP